jgi:endo-1,4-beta-xylanase
MQTLFDRHPGLRMSLSRPFRLVPILVLLVRAGFGADEQAARPATGAPLWRNNPQSQAKAEWLDPDHGAPNGTHYGKFSSKVLGREVSYLVYLPPDYEQQTKRYPVIYWLHGMGGNQRAGAMAFVPHVDAAIRQGLMPPAIVVLVNGMVNSFYCDSSDGQRPVESVVIKDLIPHIDQTYRTLARRKGRLIQGYSMGGFGAAHLGFKYPELFGAVAVDAGALIDAGKSNAPRGGPLREVFGDDQKRRSTEQPNQLARTNAAKLRNQTHIHIGCGSLDNLLPRNLELHELLRDLGIEHQYEVVPGVAHNSALYYKTTGMKAFDFHRKIFEELKGAGHGE